MEHILAEVNYHYEKNIYWCDIKKIRRHVSAIVLPHFLLFFFFLSDKIHTNNFCYDKTFMATFFREIFSVKYIYFTKKSPLMLWPCVESPSSHGYFFFFFLSQNPRGANATGSFAQHSRLCDVHILINFSRPFFGALYIIIIIVKKPEMIVHIMLLHILIYVDVFAFFGLTFGLIHNVLQKRGNRWNYKS